MLIMKTRTLTYVKVLPNLKKYFFLTLIYTQFLLLLHIYKLDTAHHMPNTIPILKHRGTGMLVAEWKTSQDETTCSSTFKNLDCVGGLPSNRRTRSTQRSELRLEPN